MSIYQQENHVTNIEAFYAVHLREFSMTPHAHNRCEVMYVVSGSCTVAAADRLLQLREREFVFLDQEVDHCLTVTRDSSCTLLNLEFALRPEGPGFDLANFTASSPSFRRFLAGGEGILKLYDSCKMGFALKDLIGELDGKGQRDPALVQLLFCRMLVELSSCTAEDSRAAGSALLNKAVRFIADHLFEELDVAAVTGQVGLNSAYLQTLFSKQFGCGIIAYVNRQRMEYATFLLKNSDKSINDVAYDLGYNSRQHFGYLFQRHFGMSPKQYRQLSSQVIQPSTGKAQFIADASGCFQVALLEK